MKNFQGNELDGQYELLGFFDQAYLFGSSLFSNEPNDLDILLVYDENMLEQVKSEKARVEEKIEGIIGIDSVDLTVLSLGELEQTNFLKTVSYRKLKG